MGRAWTAEQRATHSAFMKGKRFSLGVRPSAETRAKLSAAKRGNKNRLGRPMSEEMKQRLRVAHTGRKRLWRPTDATRARMSASARRRGISPGWQVYLDRYLAGLATPEGRERMRAMGLRSLDAIKKRIEQLDRRGRLWRFRSKWEARFATYLDNQGLTWSYEPHRLLLSDGRVYVPDFYVEEWASYVEVKGWSGWRQDKAELAQRDGHALRLLTKPDLRASGVRVRA